MRRKTTFTEGVGRKIIEQLTDGISALAISKLEGMPNERIIRRWAVDPELSSAAFPPKYARARELGADHEFDRIEELEEKLEAGTLETATISEARVAPASPANLSRYLATNGATDANGVDN